MSRYSGMIPGSATLMATCHGTVNAGTGMVKSIVKFRPETTLTAARVDVVRPGVPWEKQRTA